MSEPLLSLLVRQAPIVVLAVVMMVAMYRYMNRQIRYYQKRNEELSTLLADSALKFSEERSSIIERECKERSSLIERSSREREQMRTELLLQCDSMSRNTLAFLKEGLLQSLGDSGDESGG